MTLEPNSVKFTNESFTHHCDSPSWLHRLSLFPEDCRPLHDGTQRAGLWWTNRGKMFSKVEGRGIKSQTLRPEGSLELNVSVTYWMSLGRRRKVKRSHPTAGRGWLRIKNEPCRFRNKRFFTLELKFTALQLSLDTPRGLRPILSFLI